MLVLNGSLGIDSRSATMEFPDVEFLEPDLYLIKVAVMAPTTGTVKNTRKLVPVSNRL